MADKRKRTQETSGGSLFSQGWLDRHIDLVTAEIAQRPLAQRPHLTGARSEVMHATRWDLPRKK
ncbi:hypothetical protein [Nocardioides rubriscoriae]|uniref:hypothetical protein n=1 Tax=Nocardioides rubriscoriae TaxID=642762 RepID=UPI0011DF5219|nr:hypothetical protein [Nocardioides rubriscoriae]